MASAVHRVREGADQPAGLAGQACRQRFIHRALGNQAIRAKGHVQSAIQAHSGILFHQRVANKPETGHTRGQLRRIQKVALIGLYDLGRGYRCTHAVVVLSGATQGKRRNCNARLLLA